MFVVATCAVVLLSLLGIPQHFSQDGWLALVAGRQIAAHGIPHYDYFTHMAYGVRWVDQQWLAHLLMYELERLGGLQLLTVFYVLLTGAAFAGGVAAARALGGEDLNVLKALVPAAFFYLVTAVSIRTQGFAYPLFVTTLWLLAAEARRERPGRRVYWVFPILILWGNLHGSATLGAGLVTLYGLTLLSAGIRNRDLSALTNLRTWAFVVIPPLTLLVTPYGLSMVHYYRVTLLNPQFSRAVTEWKPITSAPILAIPLLVVLTLTALTQLRAWWRARTGQARSVPLYDALVLAVLAVGAIMAVRNVTWLGLALMMLLPTAITRMQAGAAAPLRRSRLNLVLALTVVLLTVTTAMVIVTRPASWFTSTYPNRVVPQLETLVLSHPRATIFADVRYADWLIWENPGLFSGRVAYDTSLELLSRTQLSAISDPAAASASGRHGLLADYPIWLLYPTNRKLDRELLNRPEFHVIARDKKIIIAARTRVAP